MADKNEIKSHLDTLFVFASQVPYKSEHLLPVVQASKSLIGIKLEAIPSNLLKWLESARSYWQSKAVLTINIQ